MAIRSSSCFSVSRFRSRSKVPPQLEQPALGVSEPTRALGLCHCLRPHRGEYDTSRPPGGERLGCHCVWLKIAVTGASNHPATTKLSSEHFLPARENVVQRILEVRRRFGELLPDLVDVLFVALLDLFT